MIVYTSTIQEERVKALAASLGDTPVEEVVMAIMQRNDCHVTERELFKACVEHVSYDLFKSHALDDMEMHTDADYKNAQKNDITEMDEFDIEEHITKEYGLYVVDADGNYLSPENGNTVENVARKMQNDDAFAKEVLYTYSGEGHFQTLHYVCQQIADRLER